MGPGTAAEVQMPVVRMLPLSAEALPGLCPSSQAPQRGFSAELSAWQPLRAMPGCCLPWGSPGLLSLEQPLPECLGVLHALLH